VSVVPTDLDDHRLPQPIYFTRNTPDCVNTHGVWTTERLADPLCLVQSGSRHRACRSRAIRPIARSGSSHARGRPAIRETETSAGFAASVRIFSMIRSANPSEALRDTLPGFTSEGRGSARSVRRNNSDCLTNCTSRHRTVPLGGVVRFRQSALKHGHASAPQRPD
jgi:hypothetical protein